MTASPEIFPSESERRKNYELRSIVEFLTDTDVATFRSSWACISETHHLIGQILQESKDLSVSQDLLNTFETNRRVIDHIYNPESNKPKKLANPLSAYLTKLVDFTDRIFKTHKEGPDEAPEIIRQKLDEFVREYVVKIIQDERVVLLLLLTIIYRKIQLLPTTILHQRVKRLSDILQKNKLRADKSLTILIYNLCQSSVDAINETEYAHASLYCERAVELFKLISEGAKVKEIIRGQIEDALRITTERLVNRIQEKEESDQIQIIESVVHQLTNIDLIAYLLPQLVFFLIRAQKYEDCLHHLDRIIRSKDLSRQFMNYQTAITIGHEWCDSLLKAERYSRGKVEFSYIQNQKDNIKSIFDLAKSITIPEMEDETFYNVEVERLAVTFSHLGTLFFQTGDIELAAASYERSFGTILTKKCSRNRDSVDEIMDRYKDTIHHPLNSAPMEAHSLIGVFASEKGYDFLVESQVKRYEKEGQKIKKEDLNLSTLENTQKEMIADLMDASKNKLKTKFAKQFEAYRPFIEKKYGDVKKKLKI